MAKRKIPYTKRATTYDEQIANLRRHGVVYSDAENKIVHFSIRIQ